MPPADNVITELIWAWSVPGRLARRLGTVSLGSPTARKIGPGGRWESACSTSGPGFHPFFLTVSRAARAASEVDEKAMWFPSIRIVGRTPGGRIFSRPRGASQASSKPPRLRRSLDGLVPCAVLGSLLHGLCFEFLVHDEHDRVQRFAESDRIT